MSMVDSCGPPMSATEYRNDRRPRPSCRRAPRKLEANWAGAAASAQASLQRSTTGGAHSIRSSDMAATKPASDAGSELAGGNRSAASSCNCPSVHRQKLSSSPPAKAMAPKRRSTGRKGSTRAPAVTLRRCRRRPRAEATTSRIASVVCTTAMWEPPVSSFSSRVSDPGCGSGVVAAAETASPAGASPASSATSAAGCRGTRWGGVSGCSSGGRWETGECGFSRDCACGFSGICSCSGIPRDSSGDCSFSRLW
mmetsp:Transcript_13472/g.40758  ORF Transcript_13472/g.40758 Transcript_13472/m.40758 type:complete len:253 (-) Transcript_13472:240-998(-)